jgi:nickel-dependent lactate racemase
LAPIVSLSLPYGHRNLDVELPKKNILCILSPRDLPRTRDEKQEVIRSLNCPIASSKIGNLAHECKSVVIVTDDYTRATPTRVIVPLILSALNKAKIRDEQIRIVVALGTHRPMTKEEFFQKFGGEILERIQVKNHDFRDPCSLVFAGYMSDGAPVIINKEVCEAELKIGIGNIVPHHACGWAGGAKIVLPGISGEKTTASMHLLSARTRRSYLGILENPVRKMMEDAAGTIDFDTVFNTVLNRQGGIIKAFFGNIAQAFRQGVTIAKAVYSVEMPALADIVVASSHPYDVDFWQAHKTLHSADMAVKDDGTIVLATPCHEGISKTHKELFSIAGLGHEEIEARLMAGEVDDVAAAAQGLAWAQIRSRAKIILVSDGISSRDAKRIGFGHCKSVKEALEISFQRHGGKAKVAVLTGADILPLPVRH